MNYLRTIKLTNVDVEPAPFMYEFLYKSGNCPGFCIPTTSKKCAATHNKVNNA